jgi:hypothetical protein
MSLLKPFYYNRLSRFWFFSPVLSQVGRLAALALSQPKEKK